MKSSLLYCWAVVPSVPSTWHHHHHHQTLLSFPFPRPFMDGHLRSSGFVCAVLLSLWDNIVGPAIVQVWRGDDTLPEDVQMCVARQSLDGEISHLGEDDEQMDTKFHDLTELGYTFTSIIFSGPHNGSITKYALSTVSRVAHLSYCLPLHHIIEDRLDQMARKCRALLNAGDDHTIAILSTLINTTVPNLAEIYAAHLSPVVFNNTLFMDATADQDFLARAITSHLQTHGNCVVVGSNETTVNVFVDTLSLFLSSDERRRSARAGPNHHHFTPDLCLQGLVNVNISDDMAIQACLPSTIIDVDAWTVSQCRLYHEYTVLRRELLEAEVKQLMRQEQDPVQSFWSEQDSLFHVMTRPAPCVQNLVSEVFQLNRPLREVYITQSFRILVQKAILLVKFVKAERANAPFIAQSVVRRMKEDMGITSDEDFFILLALAEKLSPGTYTSVVGDPGKVGEKVLELFESF